MIEFPIWIGMSISFKGSPTTIVKDTYDIPTLVDRIDYDIPRWMNENVKGGWGALQYDSDVYYWFEFKDEAALFKLTWCE